MFRNLCSVVVTCVLTFGLASSGAAKTVALVVGNDDYTYMPKLSVAVADAKAHCAHLRDVRNFDDVSCLFNASKAEMDRAVLGFLTKLEPDDTAMVVFSGHGVQLNQADPNTVFLLPVDLNHADIPKGSEEFSLAQFSTQFNTLRKAVKSRDVRLSVYVLDNCRDNPFNNTTTRGLSLAVGLGAVPADRGEFIFFSASEGEVALDRVEDDDPNSPFTTAFIDSFRPNIPLVTVANVVERAVIRITKAATGSAQRPRYDDNVEGPGCIEGAGACDGQSRVAKVEFDIDGALSTLRFADLKQVLPHSSNHPRLPEVVAALEVHKEIDRQQTALDTNALQGLYGQMSGHPRREEVRELIRRAILLESCITLQRYGWACPPSQNQTRSEEPKVAVLEQPTRKVAPKVEERTETTFERLSAPVDLDTLGAFSLPMTNIQSALAAAGHYGGKVDGVGGPGTNRAIAAWRAEVGSTFTANKLDAIELTVLLQHVAERSPQSKALLGLLFAQGIGFEKNKAKGSEMLDQAAKAGFPDARAWLAQLKEL